MSGQLTVTVVLNPIKGDEEVLDPSFTYRPPLFLSFPSPTKNTESMASTFESPDPHPKESLSKCQGGSTLSLGRNIWTRIFDTKLSRKLATLEFRDPPSANQKPRLMLKMNQSFRTHMLCVNGSRVLLEEMEIFQNDVICLYGDKYQYKVTIIEDRTGEFSDSSGGESNIQLNEDRETEVANKGCEENPSTRSSSPNFGSQQTQESEEKELKVNGVKRKNEDTHPSTEATDKVQETSRKHIIDELTCTICMEIIVHCHVANPCGHVFCKSCIDRIPSVQKKRYRSKSCPSCRKEITSLSWMRCLDNIIWNMVLSGEIFGEGLHGEEDLNQFLRRCGRNLHDLTEAERACIFRRCKRQKIKIDDSEEVFPTLFAPAPHPPVFPHPPAFPHFNFRNQLLFHAHAPAEMIQLETAEGTLEDPICLDD
jgi:hypothetical protein